jgi:hypothetical protein
MMFTIIVSVLLLASCAPLMTKFLLYIMGNPHHEHVNIKAIFAQAGLWVAEGYDRTDRKIAERISGKFCDTRKVDRYAATQKNWYMMLGACPYCMNVWVSGLLLTSLFLLFGIPLWNLVYAMPVGHYVLGLVLD